MSRISHTPVMQRRQKEGEQKGNPRMAGHGAASQPSSRQRRLLDHLQSRSYLDVQQVCALLEVSEATARRDLAELETRGLLRRTHGGALPLLQITQDFPNDERLWRNADEKARIGKVAADLVAEGDAVFLDAGTTTLHVARRLARRADLTFITNGAGILACLSEARAERLFAVGGAYCAVNNSMTGPIAADTIRRFNVDKLFLSVSAVDPARGQISISTPDLALAQQAMIEIAQQVIVVADRSKFNRNALSVIAPLSAVDRIVTDAACRDLLEDAPEPLLRKMIFA
ncbi:MAG: DeoR/GlpR transcriptional regulator [Rhodobacteraceae bacterium]|nr:MAG: DeoR/GlpR transcriptional regulator [Paracoccaceae bacterium]